MTRSQFCLVRSCLLLVPLAVTGCRTEVGVSINDVGGDAAGDRGRRPSDSIAGDPQTGDPQTGDPQTGDPQTGDPGAGDPPLDPCAGIACGGHGSCVADPAARCVCDPSYVPSGLNCVADNSDPTAAIGLEGCGWGSTTRIEHHVGAGQTYATVAAAFAAADGGDIICIHAGTYVESELTPPTGPNGETPTIVTGVMGQARPIIDTGATANNIVTMDLSSVSNVVVHGLELRTGNNNNMMIGDQSGGSNITVAGCLFYGTNLGGVTVNNPSHIFVGYQGTVDTILIRNNIFADGDVTAVKIDTRNRHASNVEVAYNEFYNVHGGIYVKWVEPGVDRGQLFHHNVLHDVGRAIATDQDYTVIEYNVIHDTTGQGILFGDNMTAGNLLIAHNSLMATGGIAGIVTCNPGVPSCNGVIRDNIVGSGGINHVEYFTVSNNHLGSDCYAQDLSLLPGSACLGAASDGSDQGAL